MHSQSSKKKKKKKPTGTAQEQISTSGIPAVCPQRTGQRLELTCIVQDDTPADNIDPDGEDHPLLAKVICIIRRRPNNHCLIHFQSASDEVKSCAKGLRADARGGITSNAVKAAGQVYCERRTVQKSEEEAKEGQSRRV